MLMVAQLVEHLIVSQKVEGSNPFHQPTRSHRLVWPRTPACHAGNTGSNPVGTATNNLYSKG